jgi:hypothetical protein
MKLWPAPFRWFLLGLALYPGWGCKSKPPPESHVYTPDADVSPDPKLRTAADTAPGVRIFQVSAGQAHSCGLLTDSSVICWGGTLTCVNFPWGGGDNFACAITHTGQERCWGAIAPQPL